MQGPRWRRGALSGIVACAALACRAADDGVGSAAYPRGVDTASPPRPRLGAHAAAPLSDPETSLQLPAERALRPCSLDADALALQRQLAALSACACGGHAAPTSHAPSSAAATRPPAVPPSACDPAARPIDARMRAHWGLGAELSTLLKPLARAVERRAPLLDPVFPRAGCEPTAAESHPPPGGRAPPLLSSCLGLRPSAQRSCAAVRAADGSPADNGSAAAAAAAARPAAAAELVRADVFSRTTDARVPAPYAHAKSLFWWTGQALAFLLRPAPPLLRDARAQQARWGWGARAGERVLGLHVRRGDTCLRDWLTRDAAAGYRDGVIERRHARRCDPLSAYAPAARALARAHNLSAVFIATDDEAVVAAARAAPAALLGVRRVYALGRDVLNRSMYWRGYMDDVLRGAEIAISDGGGAEIAISDEGAAPGAGAAGPGGAPPGAAPTRRGFDARADARATMLDLLLLADCDAHVGKATSNLFRHALALSNAFKGGDCVVPYASLDALWCASHGKRVGVSFVDFRADPRPGRRGAGGGAGGGATQHAADAERPGASGARRRRRLRTKGHRFYC